MYVSKYNLSFKVQNEMLLFNPLSGAIDIVDERVIDTLESLKNDKNIPNYDDRLIGNLQKRGYIFSNKKDEDERLQELYQAYQDWMALTPRNFVLSTTYSCNLNCKYCFQAQKRKLYKDVPVYMEEDMLNKAFDFMVKINEEILTTGRSEITIYGGEPLQADKRHKAIIKLALERSKKHNFWILVITNGADLIEYVDMFVEYEAGEIQVTLDGPRKVHNRRRPFTDGRESFDRIVEGIDAALARGLRINLRFVGDKDNIDSVPELVEFMVKKGWYDKPTFKTHIGRMCCGLTPEYEHNLLNPNQFIKKLVELYKTDSQVEEKVPSRLVGLDRLLSTGMPYPPIFDACPGTKLEYALDVVGKVYPCSLGVGMDEFLVGEYYPKIKFYPDKLSKWQNRNIFNNPECKKCNVSLLCGGGCPRDALETKGSPHASACRPVKQNLGDGITYYFSKIKEMAEKGGVKGTEISCCR